MSERLGVCVLQQRCPAGLFWPSARLLMALLARRGYQVMGSVSRRRAYDWGSLPLPAGNLGHPDANDLNVARERAAACRAPGAALSRHRALAILG